MDEEIDEGENTGSPPTVVHGGKNPMALPGHRFDPSIMDGVLDSLRREGDINVLELARRHNCSRQQIWKILKELRKRRMILGTSAIINEQALGWDQSMVFLPMKKLSIADVETILDRESTFDIPETLWIREMGVLFQEPPTIYILATHATNDDILAMQNLIETVFEGYLAGPAKFTPIAVPLLTQGWGYRDSSGSGFEGLRGLAR